MFFIFTHQNRRRVTLIYGIPKKGVRTVNDEGYAALVARLKPKLYRTAFLYLNGEAQALDAVDEAVYRGLLSLKSLRRPEYAATWLTRILINECKRVLRHRKREQPLDTLPETAAERFDALPLKEAIRRLPPKLRDVVILRFYADYTLEETAAALRTPRGTVSARQTKALKLLRLELSDPKEEK
jgi:RNA polymerase sigma-70 factor (ECF subfamily)